MLNRQVFSPLSINQGYPLYGGLMCPKRVSQIQDWSTAAEIDQINYQIICHSQDSNWLLVPGHWCFFSDDGSSIRVPWIWALSDMDDLQFSGSTSGPFLLVLCFGIQTFSFCLISLESSPIIIESNNIQLRCQHFNFLASVSWLKKTTIFIFFFNLILWERI